MRLKILFLYISMLYGFCSISWAVAADRPTVFVSIVPQRFFVQQISKDLLQVEVMVQPGASPATYEPKPSQMAKLSSSAAYFAIGVPFEQVWLGRFSAINPAMRIIHTDRGIDKIAMVRHSHEEDEKKMQLQGNNQRVQGQGDEHLILDPHIWLSPALVKKQAAVILEGLIAIAPRHAAQFEQNYQDFMARIDQLDDKLRSSLKKAQGSRFMVFHPSWGYFAKEYGLEQMPIEIEGKSPRPAQLKEIIEHARQENIRIIFVQPQFSAKSAKVVAAEIGGDVVFIDPLAEDWFANLSQVAGKLQSAATPH